MPEAPVRVLISRVRVRQCEMCTAALTKRGRLVHRRAHQGMAEGELEIVGLEQARALRRAESIRGQSEIGRGGEDGCELPGVIGGGEQQRRLGRFGETLDLSSERDLQAGAQRYRLRHRRPASELRIREARWQLEQGERVAGCVGEHSLAYP